MAYPSRRTLKVLPQFRGTATVRQTPEQRSALLAFIATAYREARSIHEARGTGRAQPSETDQDRFSGSEPRYS